MNYSTMPPQKEDPILRIALPVPLRRVFDYLPPQDVDSNKIKVGVRVRVPFQSRTLVGVLVDITQQSSLPRDKLKFASEILDTDSIWPFDVYKLCQWASEYYHYSLGEVLMHALPALLRKGKTLKTNSKLSANLFMHDSSAEEVIPELNHAQSEAVKTILTFKNKFQPFLLEGVTGSGKTEVYLRVIENILHDQKQVLVLVPEISLTPQTIERFRKRFPLPMVSLHSDMTDKERLQAWHAARNQLVQIVIGTRSAIFTPFAKLGLIIVDEEHDLSFKQQDRFRYHGRDLAVMRASLNQIPIVLGSATPSLESLLNVKRKRYQHLFLAERAGIAQLPSYRVIDLKKCEVEEGLSLPLLQAMQSHLAQDNQVLLFLNRRGFSPVLYCTQCAWIAECHRCDARLVYHHSPKRLRCHHCDAVHTVPHSCAQCGDTNLQPVGLGTQRLQETLVKHFPTIPIIRVDRDNTKKKGTLIQLLEKIQTEKKAILIGTQMLAKGHHFPRVTLAGIVDADGGLFCADFRAAEQMGQLLMQVSGRAGREDKPGTVAIQTRHPSHPLLRTLIEAGYQSFAQSLLNERETALLPPYSYFAIFRAEAYIKEHANYFLQAIKKMLPESFECNVLGPVPAIIAKRKGLHCQHLLVRTQKRSLLQSTLKNVLHQLETLSTHYSVKWVLDVDPVEV